MIQQAKDVILAHSAMLVCSLNEVSSYYLYIYKFEKQKIFKHLSSEV